MGTINSENNNKYEIQKLVLTHKPIDALKDIINLENIIKVYDNTTGNEIIKNEYFIFIPKEFYYVFELYNEAFNYKNKELIIPINTNDKRNPEWDNIIFEPLFRIEINNGYLFITKLLDNVTIQED